MKTTIINSKKYTVEHVFNMVANWYFTDKNGVAHLVDGEDVTIFGGGGECQFEYDGSEEDIDWYRCTTHDEMNIGNTFSCNKWVNNPTITIDTAIAYAKKKAKENEGIFWWKTI